MKINVFSFKPHTKRKLNILMFGLSNNGKSSLINSILTARDDATELNKTEVNKTVKVRDSSEKGEHCTMTLESFDLTSFITIFDVWGWVAGINFTKNEFESILRGVVPAGITVTAVDNFLNEAASTTTAPEPQSCLGEPIDAVVFVVSAENVEASKDIKGFVEKALALGVKVVVALTMVDKVENSVTNVMSEEHLFQVETGKVKEAMTKVRAFVPSHVDIVPVVNNTSTSNFALPVSKFTAASVLRKICNSVGGSYGNDYMSWFPVDPFSKETLIDTQFSQN